MKKKNVYVILILAILLLPFKVHATENVSLSIDCSELIINESKTCNLYADVKESHQIKGVQGKVTGENVTFEEFKVSTSPSWSTSLVNGNAIAIANGTGYSGRTKLGTIKIKATALEGAKLSFTEVTYSIDSDEADEEEGNVEFTFTVKERQSSGTSESNTGNPTGGSGNSGGSGGSGGSSTTEPKDAECSLKSLEIENATMTPKFKPDIFEYEITTEATEINIK